MMENLETVEQKLTKNHKILRTIRILIPLLFVLYLILSYFCFPWSDGDLFLLGFALFLGIPTLISLEAVLTTLIKRPEGITGVNQEKKNYTGLRILRNVMPIICFILYSFTSFIFDKWWCSTIIHTNVCWEGDLAALFYIFPVFVIICIVVMLILTKKIKKMSQKDTESTEIQK